MEELSASSYSDTIRRVVFRGWGVGYYFQKNPFVWKEEWLEPLEEVIFDE